MSRVRSFKEVDCDGTQFVIPEHINFKCPNLSPLYSEPPPNPWSLIHYRIANAKVWDADEQRAYYENEWLGRIPNCGSCREHWVKLTAERPIDWQTQESAFRSMWELHNIVSRDHSHREQVDYLQAWDLWSGPRVAFLAVTYSSHGGTETFHQTLLPRLKHFRNIVGFGCLHGGGDTKMLGVPVYSGPEAIQSLCRKVDIVVTWGISELTDLLPDKRPKVIAVHHSDMQAGWLTETSELKVVDEFVSVNKEAADYMHKKRGLPAHYIPNAIDPLRIKPTGNQATLRKQFRIPDDAKVIFFGHRLSPEKQPVLAVEIAKQLPDNWIVVIAGDGVLKPEVDKATANVSNVRIVGRVDTLADWLSISDCFLSLSTFEGFGLSMAEALACGVPLVSSPVGIAPGLAARLVDVDARAEEWAAVVVASLGEGRKQACGLFSVDEHVSKWAQLLSP